ncbi:ATP-dependent RNA helicase [Venturia nashicola]|uniref:ATP-dependent RNA helicase n=1 Tax=Venturia nashicola TaxID=86259 RepID=A0A4Z1NLQ8_9PEZI|nr:ATP-dependent RNA helicase [Venturia nashicola]TLD18932.1 ATP-dependent RNA helicase [Venturia nashicola]
MAIIPRFPGLEVTVTVDGNPLHEYDLPDDTDEIESDASAIRYIEAQPGVEFAVHIKSDPVFEYNDNDTCVKVIVDGKDYLTRAKAKSKATITDSWTMTLTGSLLASGKNLIERNWMFSTLKTVGGPMKEPESDLRDRFNGLGQIIVVMHRVTFGQKVELDPKKFKHNTSAMSEKVPEKALKGRALSRKAGLGAARLFKETHSHDYTWIDAENEPYATFTFRYRSMDDLYAEIIIPRPIPLEQRDVATLTIEELNELLKRQEAGLERQELQRRVEENRKILSGGIDGRKEGKMEVKKELKLEHESDFTRAANRCRTQTIDLSEDGLKKELRRERDFPLKQHGNAGTSKRRRIETVDLTDD